MDTSGINRGSVQEGFGGRTEGGTTPARTSAHHRDSTVRKGHRGRERMWHKDEENTGRHSSFHGGHDKRLYGDRKSNGSVIGSTSGISRSVDR